MRTVTTENLVEFSELCIFAEAECGVDYNTAHDVLSKDAYPGPEFDQLGLYLSEFKKYPEMFNPEAVRILCKFMETNGVKSITVTKD